MALPSLSFPKVSARLRPRWQLFCLDMTPMVDLAFVLLTFLMLQVSMTRPSVIQLMMPSKQTVVCSIGHRSSGIMTIMLGRKHRLYYYYGLNQPLNPSMPAPEVKTTDFSVGGIRRVLLANAKPRKIIILIKPTSGATFKDMVDILDEMSITDQVRYALVQLPANDAQLLQKAGY